MLLQARPPVGGAPIVYRDFRLCHFYVHIHLFLSRSPRCSSHGSGHCSTPSHRGKGSSKPRSPLMRLSESTFLLLIGYYSSNRPFPELLAWTSLFGFFFAVVLHNACIALLLIMQLYFLRLAIHLFFRPLSLSFFSNRF